MSSAVGAMPGARLTAAQRKQQFLDVAAQLVVEQGADTVTMEAVPHAGVSKALSYRYFSNAARCCSSSSNARSSSSTSRSVTL